MKIHVPEEIGGKLKVLPECQVSARIQDLFLGESQTGNPKLTAKWVIIEECTDKKALKAVQQYNTIETIVGENVLEAFSLLPNAIWNLNDLFSDVTGERIPHEDYEPEAFLQMMKDALIGVEARLDLMLDSSTGSARTVVNDRRIIP